MPVAKAVTDLKAPDLVKNWRSVVNDNVMMGRDAHLLSEALQKWTPVQILKGIYQYQDSKSLTIPSFLRMSEFWLEDDDIMASIELARYITKSTPKQYWAYQDWKDIETAEAFTITTVALASLKEWAERITG